MQKTRSQRSSQERWDLERPNYIHPIVHGNSDFAKVLEMNKEQTQQIEELKSNYRYLETQLQLQYEQEVRLTSELDGLRFQNKQLQDALKDSEFKLAIERKDVQIYQAQVLKLEEECNFQLETIKTQKSQIDMLQEKVEGLQNRHQAERQLLKQQLMDKELEGKMQQSELRRWQEEAKILKAQKAEVRLARDEQQAKLQLEQTVGRQKERIEELEKELEKARGNLETTLVELEAQMGVKEKLQQQIQQLNQQFQKEKQAIESYYLDQLQKQDQQLQQMIKSSVQQEHKLQIQKLQAIIESKENLTAKEGKLIKDLERKNVTLVMEVERLNSILKQKLTELEALRSEEGTSKKCSDEVELWKGKFVTLNKQYHASQEQLMVLRTELDTLKKK